MILEDKGIRDSRQITFFSLSLNCHDFLEMIVESFPFSLSTFFEFGIVHFQGSLQSKTRRVGRVRKGIFDFPKDKSAK